MKAVLGEILSPPSRRKQTLRIDVEELLVTRLLLQADSGAGKSYALRRILEQTYGLALQWVIDPEGEFGTLREKGDYVIVGGENADVPVPSLPPGASQAEFDKLVASFVVALVELKVNVVFDLFDLSVAMDAKTKNAVGRGVAFDATRAGFVASLFRGLIALPKKLWCPMIVAVDEAQTFAPEGGGKESPALVPLADWSARARKRGQCPLYSTNSLAMLANDVMRGVQNYLIGRCALDADNKRAAKYLRLDTDGQEELRLGMGKGEFFCFGPALSSTIAKVKVGKVETSHPTPGKPAPVVPEPPEKVKKVLAQLALVPKKLKEEAVTIEKLKARITELEAEMAKRKIEVEVEEVEIDKKALKRLEAVAASLEKIQKIEAQLLDRKAQALQVVASELDSFRIELAKVTGAPAPAPRLERVAEGVIVRGPAVDRLVDRRASADEVNDRRPRAAPTGAVKSGAIEMLRVACILGESDRFTICVLAGIVPGGGTASDYFAALKREGLIVEPSRGIVQPTADGRKQWGSTTGVLTPLHDLIAQSGLKAGARKMLEVLVQANGKSMTRADICALAGIEPGGGTASDYFAALKRRGFVEERQRSQVELTRASRLALGWTRAA